MNDLALGLEHFNAGRYGEALLRFQAARAAGERGPAAGCFTAHALDSLGRPREALAAFTSVIEAFPSHLPAYAGLANLMLHRGSFEHDRATLRRILFLKPRGEEARRGLLGALKICAQAFRAAGDLALAEAALRKVLASAPSDAEARGRLVALIRMRAQAQLGAGSLERAQKALRQALALAPCDEETRGRLADLLRLRAHEQTSARRLGTAERLLRDALAVAPADARSRRGLSELLRRRGKAARAAGRLADAEKSLRAALKLQPRDDKTRQRLLELLGLRARAALAEGRPALAEKAWRRALALEPRGKDARRGLLGLLRAVARRLSPAGEAPAAVRAWRRALAFEPRDLEARRALVELLRAAVAAALDGPRPAADAALRAALAFSPGDREARRRLAELLRARGLAELFARRLARAERLFRGVLRCDPLDGAACLSLASVMSASGRRDEERALLRRAAGMTRGTAPGDRFKALMKLGRYKEAVAAAERILDERPSLPDIRCFWDPWDWDERVSRDERRRELARLERALATRPASPWLHYYRGALSGPEGLADFEALSAFPARRYGWMYFKAGAAALSAAAFDRADAWFTRSLAGKPADWRARCFLAEAHLCRGNSKAAFAEMDRALRAAPKVEAGQVLAWRGAFELWLGRYARAIALLDKAEALGAQCAFCWKGAALLKLGRPAEALAELDRGLRLYPLDFEAYVWRGEAKRALGLHREALQDLDERAVADPDRATPIWLWARFNRALAKKALGDLPGMIADFDAIPAYVIEHLRLKTGLEKREDLLEAGLRLSRGFRRDEYRQAVWMSEPKS